MKSARTFTLYETLDGGWSTRWSNQDGPTATGVLVDGQGCMTAPWCSLVVRAVNAKQATYFAYNSVTTSGRADGLGIWWNRCLHDGPAPLSADEPKWGSVMEFCGERTVFLFDTRKQAKHANENWPRLHSTCYVLQTTETEADKVRS